MSRIGFLASNKSVNLNNTVLPMPSKVLLTSILLLTLPSVTAAQDRSTILVLDGSGSMWAALPEGRSRIEVARDVLGDFLTARDPAQPLGVIAYGHNRRGDCSDIETLAPVGLQDGRDLGGRLRALMPRGKTPLADALRRAAAELPPQAEEADIVLITDGLETCGGDPCAVAAELASAGVPIRAHVVGFGLSEGEVRQIACVAEATGGLVLAPQSGTELSEALLRTASAPTMPAAPDTAAIHLTIRADIAGRPDRVAFRAVNTGTGETRDLGMLDFALAQHLTVELAEGGWTITADAGDEGHGETVAQIIAGENATIYVPFRGLLPSLEMPAPAGPFRAGVIGLIPYRILEEGLATGGADFILSVLPADAVDTADRLIDYATQESRQGAYVGTFRTPTEPGRYLLAFHRNAAMPIDEVMARFEIVVEARPEVHLVAPPAVEPGARIPLGLAGGMGQSDRVEIWRDGALYAWDQSLYVQDIFDNAYGPAKPLLAPSEPGAYELVYLFSDVDGAAAIAARMPLSVGEVPELDEAALSSAGGDAARHADAASITTLGESAAAQSGGYTCPADHGVPCILEDVQVGLLFAIPPGWSTDAPTRTSGTAGDPGAEGPVRMNVFSATTPAADTISLNPHQWLASNGPCQTVQAGQLCHFASDSAELTRGLEVLTRALRDTRPAPKPAAATPHEALNEAMADLARQDPAAAEAMEALLGAAAGGGISVPDGHGPDTIGPGERDWADYPHRCLPADKTVESCDMRDAASGLAFHLPQSWVAEVQGRGAQPQADFFEVGPGANRIALNPVDWPEQARGCALTRVGALCRDPDITDTVLSRAFDTLRFTLTTGSVLRGCADEACAFAHPNPPLSGTLPARWSVETGRALPDGRLASWFWDMDRAGNLKLMGLNQVGGEGCTEIQPGDRLCDFTPYIDDAERALIATTLTLPAPADRRPRALGDATTLDAPARAALDALLNTR